MQVTITLGGLMDLRKQYKKETNKNATWQHIEGARYTAGYVKWLENQIIGDVCSAEPPNNTVEDRQAYNCKKYGRCHDLTAVGCNEKCRSYAPAT